jgi:hypothetical protein
MNNDKKTFVWECCCTQPGRGWVQTNQSCGMLSTFCILFACPSYNADPNLCLTLRMRDKECENFSILQAEALYHFSWPGHGQKHTRH